MSRVTCTGYKSQLKEGVAYISQVWRKACASNQGKLIAACTVTGPL